jgi:hypothetical protein
MELVQFVSVVESCVHMNIYTFAENKVDREDVSFFAEFIHTTIYTQLS